MQTDNDQYEQLKTFIRENWIAITVGVVIGVGGLLGWKYYESEQITSRLNDANAYYTAITPLKQLEEATPDTPEAEELKKTAKTKVTDYLQSDTSNYAAFAALKLAKNLSAQKQFGEAEKILVEIQPKIKDVTLSAITQFTIANLQVEQEKYDEALATVEKITIESWAANKLQLKADILKRKGDILEARKLYEQAITIANPSLQDYIRLKLNNLPS